jgi:hypothetical protein
MSAEYSGSVPKVGNQVQIVGKPGQFKVADVNLLMQTVNVKATDEEGHITRNVPWTSLKL